MRTALLLLSLSLASTAAGELLFQDDFDGKLAPGWRWIREDKDAWRINDGRLEIQIQPGNMWGPENSGRNVLVRDVPDPAKQPLRITVTVENRPTEQYEQVDLVWYYTGSDMIKVGQELVDGQPSIVMGREENDRARTIAIIPIQAAKVQLRLDVREDHLEGFFRPNAEGEWRKTGECDLPAKGAPKIAIQCYQGPAEAEHWAKIDSFQIVKLTAGESSSIAD